MNRAFAQRYGKIPVVLFLGAFLLGGCIPGLHRASLEMIGQRLSGSKRLF